MSFVSSCSCEGPCICPMNHTIYTILNELPSFAHDASFVFICVCVIKLAAPWFQPYFNFLSELLTGCPQTSALTAAYRHGVNTGLPLVAMKEVLAQWRKGRGRQVARVTEFHTVAPNVSRYYVWKVHVAILVPRILRWLQDFLKICRSLV